MHDSSLLLMDALLQENVPSPRGCTVLDIGSLNLGGSTYRDMCVSRGMSYTGADLVPGTNVDRTIPESGDWGLGQFDVAISGQCLEHVKMPWLWIKQVYDSVNPGGVVILIAPWQWEVHRYPVDCWRILPDGMTALLEWGCFKDIKSGIPLNTPDCYGVGFNR